jgi:hypothetical protein
MDKKPADKPVEIPKWDVALEALVRDEFKTLRRPLGLDDFRRLGQAHSIRFHDIMETIHQLELHGKWQHQGKNGDHPASAKDLDGLYVHGRLDEDTAEKYTVTWMPTR